MLNSNNMLTHSEQLVPLWVKILYTVFIIVLVPHYLRVYGPTNFLYFCDVALFLTLASLWSESALLASVSMVGILLPQLLWILDFLGTIINLPITGMTAYMFDSKISLFTRCLSFFHFWLPLFLLWLLSRLGYDKRAYLMWSVIALILLQVCYFYMPPPPAPPDKPGLPVNINYVFGPSDNHPQQWMNPNLYFLFMQFFLLFAVFWPTHILLEKIFKPPADSRG